MSTSFSMTAQNPIRKNTPSGSDDGERNKKTKKTISASNDDSNKNSGIDEESSSIHISDSDSSDDGRIKPSCPATVNHIVNAISAVGTFGGLALIITGGMGMTLNKPVDNSVENIAMVLSGGALLVGSWLGNFAYANHQAA